MSSFVAVDIAKRLHYHTQQQLMSSKLNDSLNNDITSYRLCTTATYSCESHRHQQSISQLINDLE